MKPLLIFFTLFLSTLKLVSQNTQFEKYYNFGAAETGYCVQQTPDSGFVVCGFQGISFFSSKMIVMKTNPNGILQWSKLFGDGSNDQFAYHIINCSSGGYAVVGYKTGAGFVKDIYVLRLNSLGDTIWAKQYGTPAIEEGSSIKETQDSNFVISYFDGNDSTGILKIDSIGNLLWWKKYKIDSGAYFKDVSILSLGGYLLSGVVQTGAGLVSQAIIMRTNLNGDSLWTKKFGGIGGDEFYEAQQTMDGNIIAGGISGTSVSSPYNFYLVKTDLNGDTLWTKHIATSLNQECSSLQQCSDGGYILSGTTYPSGDANVLLIKTDALGNVLWSRSFGGALPDYSFFVRQTNDGGFVLTGTTALDPDGAGVYLVKTDSVGFVPTGIYEIPSLQNINFTFYPNPTTNLIYLKFEEEEDYGINLIDNSGRILFSDKISRSNSLAENSIDLSSFQNGIYYLQIKSAKASNTKKVIKIK
jgi:hypothetical protein